jgi:hypothetical protein
MSLACVPDRVGSQGWSALPAPDAAPPVDLFAAGGRDRARATNTLATALEGRVGENSTFVWLGAPYNPRKGCDESGKRAAAFDRLDEALDPGSAFSVGSPYEHMCGASGPTGARTPDTHYMVDLAPTGPRVHTPCYRSPDAETLPLDQVACPHDEPDEDAQVRLLFIDETLWFHQQWDDNSDEVERTLAQLDAIVDAIPQNPKVPYLLVSHFPIESEGIHGFGSWKLHTTFHHHPKSVQRAIADGRIEGVIAGLEGNLQFVDDLGLAVKRSARTWLDEPVFQVVSGAAGDPDRRHRMTIRAQRRQSSIALKNDRFTQRAGFVHLHGDSQSLTVELQARVGGTWSTTSSEVQLNRPAHPPRTLAPPLAPCRDCDPVQGATDGEKWEKRRD